MKPQELIEALRSSGVLLTVDGNKILASPKQHLTEEARRLVQDHQEALHGFLAQRKEALYEAQEVVAELTIH